MAAPSLSELTNIRVNPELGGASPRVIIDNKGVVDTLNRAAEFQTENAWKKYNNFQKNLSDIYASLDENAKLETMPQDRKILDEKTAKVYQEIASDPSALSAGSPKYRQVQEQLGSLKKDAFTSKRDYLFDQAHREFISRQPELNTPENNQKFDQFGKGELGKRQPFSLDMPPQFDYDAYRKGVLGLATKPFAETQMTGQDLKTAGRDFIVDKEGEKISKEAFTKLWNAGYETSTDKYGHSIKGAIKQRFNLLPKEVQDQYAEKAKQTGVDDPVKEFFNETGQTEYNALGQDENGFITNVKKVDTKPNPYGVEQAKADDKLKEMGVKFTYDKILEAMRIGGQKDLALYREQIKDLKQDQQAEVLNGLVDRQVQDAKQNPVGKVTAGEEYKDQYLLQVSPETYKIFGIKEKSTNPLEKGKEETEYPTQILVDDTGKTITTLFKDKNGKVDQSKTKQFPIEEYKYRLGRDVLGVGNLGKQLSAQGRQGGGTETKTETKTYKVGGKSYSESQLEKGAKASGMTLEDYKKAIGAQ